MVSRISEQPTPEEHPGNEYSSDGASHSDHADSPDQPASQAAPDAEALPEGLIGFTSNIDMNQQLKNQNPLTEYDSMLPFDRIRPEHVVPAIEAVLQEARLTVQRVVEEGDRTFENTVVVLDRALQAVDRAVETARHLKNVAHTDALEEEVAKIEPVVATFEATLETDSELFRTLSEFAATDEFSSLSESRQAAVTRRLKQMELAGAGLPDELKSELIRLEGELATQTSNFMSNLLKSTNEFELVISDQDRLAGLPESALAAARASAEAVGKEGYRFTLHAPSVMAVTRYAADQELRKEIHTAYNQRASKGDHDNSPVVKEILKLRQQKAELLGKQNLAEHILADRMAENVETARGMVARLKQKSQSAFEQDVARLKEFQQSLCGVDAELHPWDVSYYIEKLKQEELDFDEESLRPYFSLQNVLQGAFDLAERLFGVTVQEVTGYPVPHDSVTVYEIHDSDGRNLGHFYADFIVRDNKRAGAWMQPLSSTATLHADAESAVAVICGNMTAPVDGKPALLTHNEVTTVFHEFGHLLHGMLYRGELASQNGMQVEWDFIELPSQLMENWCWSREGLDLFARHYETGEAIPDELLQKLQQSRTYLGGIPFQRQLGLAEMDFALHCDYDSNVDGDPVAYARGIANQYAAAPSEISAMINSFHHLMGEPTGYACGYYSYRMAEVAEADVHERATAEQEIDPLWGRHFKEVVYRGGSAFPASQTYRKLMGRDPDENALIRREQLDRQ